MKVVEKNEGTKIGYKLRGTKLDFADGELTIDLARYQKDDEVTKDIMVDREGYLTTGRGRYYVAQVEIPAREYDEETVIVSELDENGESVERENMMIRKCRPLWCIFRSSVYVMCFLQQM